MKAQSGKLTFRVFSINFEVCIHRVLKKGGTFTVMPYNRSSINYYAEIMFLRRLFRWLLLPKFMPGPNCLAYWV
jgi:hypothetical protein